MAEIKNYSLNFGCGRPLRGLDFAAAKSAFTEVQRALLPASMVLYG